MSALEENLEDGLLTLTMNRPEVRNAMTPSMMTQMLHTLRRAADDPEIRCVVITGANGAFSSGADVNNIGDVDESGEELSLEARVQSLRRYHDMAHELHVMPKPTLAIIPGAVAGAALSLALACDMRFCLDTAKVTTAFSKIGMSGDTGGSYFLPKLVGAAKARELYFLGEVISGQEAYDMGMMTRVASADTFEQESRAFARQLASLPTLAVGYMKKNLNAGEDGTLSDVLDLEANHMMLSAMTEDCKRASAAFLNKEKPEFRGK